MIEELLKGNKEYLILDGNCLDTLKTVPDGVVQTCVTSPPYWGLRNYGTTPQFWGGDKNCQHEWETTAPRRVRTDKDVKNPTTIQNANKGSNCNLPTTLTCSKCNGWLGELGLEPTPEMFVEHLVIIFEEVKRVLKKDGTIWVNIADSYQASSGAELEDIKPKDMIGVPWLLALALRNAGWYLRQDIIWDKKNTMPESVQDRCTRSHEYIFLLSKSRKYYYDNKAVTNQAAGSEPDANLRDVWHMNSAEGYKDKDGQHHATFPYELPERCIKLATKPGDVVLDIFNGSGTTGLVALHNKRLYLGCELSPKYIEMTKERFEGGNLPLLGEMNEM